MKSPRQQGSGGFRLFMYGGYDTGEWWKRDPLSVLRQAQKTGAAPNISDAFTINGQPGDLYKCSSQGGLNLSDLI